MSTSDGTVKGIQKIVDHGDDALRWNVVILAEGYKDAELPTFLTDAQSFANTFSTTAPFDTLWSGINVHAVSVSSTDSGADDPASCGDGSHGAGTTVRSYFDATYCGGGAIRRLLTVQLRHCTLRCPRPAWPRAGNDLRHRQRHAIWRLRRPGSRLFQSRGSCHASRDARDGAHRLRTRR